MNTIKMILFDIDGVITDGRKYVDGDSVELKTIALKDMDAFQLIRDAGYRIGCVTGEDTTFSRQFTNLCMLDYVRIGCKQKEEALKEIEERYHITSSEICYVGDGKYDIPVLKKVKLAVCPNDAIEEVKQVSDVVLKRKGGEGCIAEIYSLLVIMDVQKAVSVTNQYNVQSVFEKRLAEHQDVIKELLAETAYRSCVEEAVKIIIESYEKKGKLLLCGNGGSAADAQHLAAELVGRFYLERKALSAEALTVNTSILTSLANDYDYNMIFARQLEAKAVAGDVLIGITTSGTSENVMQAFQKAKEMGVKTILMTGNVSDFTPVLKYTDCVLAVPSHNTPRIQEVHILTGHIICEIIEQELANK